MRIVPPPEPITAADDEIRAAIEDADVPALLASIAQVTGDLTILRPDLRPDPSNLLDPSGGLSPEQLREARELAADALCRYRDAGCPPPPPLEPSQRRSIIDYLIGGGLTDDYEPLLVEELAITGDERAPRWHKQDVAPDVEFRVAVIGAGMSGIVAAHRLRQAGIDVVVLEKNHDVGGTWFENTYPGCRVDVPNHLYSYSFAQTPDWPEFNSSQPVLRDYFHSCAERFGVLDVVRFDTEVLRADWDEDGARWLMTVRTNGTEETIAANAIVSATGQLNRPKLPDIRGRARFLGPSFHSAQWRDDVDLDAKRVAVIGTGASAIQFIPAVAACARECVVFQRTPPWLLPAPHYTEALPTGLRWLLTHVPGYVHWDRLWQFWRLHEGMLPAAVVDPEWDGDDAAVSALSDGVRAFFTSYLESQISDPQLAARVIPRYPPFAKRMVLDNGIWPATLQRPNVRLVTDGIKEIVERGIVTEDGTEHAADVIIYGTGFDASNFLTPMRVRGVGGIDLHESWDGDARAYLGITIPEFPNLFLMYGPNTNIVVNGSIIYFSECETSFILEAVRLLLASGNRAMHPRREVHDAYNERVDAGNQRMAWGASDVSAWYKNSRGRVSQNWPFTLLEYWQQTRSADPDDYVLS